MARRYDTLSLTPLYILLCIMITMTQCSSDDAFFSDSITMLEVDGEQGFSRIHLSYADIIIHNLPAQILSDKEIKGLQYLREAEKLASDFYDVMSDQWNDPILNNLGSAESTHFGSFIFLLHKYDLEDPTAFNNTGIYMNTSIQVFYNSLIARGNMSMLDAYTASGRLGESEIVLLRDQLDRIVNNEDMRILYRSLITAARNHLRVIAAQHARLGTPYQPVILSQVDYFEIINSDFELEAEE